jgi:ubiquinone/menaquinone biosynthesis C-methylase UbiE
MIKETVFFFRHGPATSRRQAEMGLVEFQKWLANEVDKDGYKALREGLVQDLRGEILEVGAGTGAMFSYYGEGANVVALEPDDPFRAAAEEAAKNAHASIEVVGGSGESLPFPDASFDAVVASTVLCSVTSMEQTLAEFKRVLKPGGRLRLLEHVRSEHWPEGALMDMLNPVWLRINKVGCNWNRRPVEAVRDAGFQIDDVEPHKLFSPAAPATMPLRLIKARI